MNFVQHLGPILTILGAVTAAILPGFGSAKAVGRAGEAAAGVLAEDPDKYSKLLILQALPGTQGIYGVMSWFIIMLLSGLMAGNADISPAKGLLFFLTSLPVALVGYISALYQGKVAEAGIALVAKRASEQSKALVLAAMVETYAILALLATMLGCFRIAGLNI